LLTACNDNRVLKMPETILPVSVTEELRTSFLDYSMSVIMSRALPDVRDGLKPSQRRILVAMNDLNLAPGRGFRKCAKIAGDTSGNYHPHGEAIVYPTLVHLAQTFRMRYPLVNGQGNFGSIDGYPPAAMRYTEARLMPAAMDMLADLDSNTVTIVPNYDDTQSEPEVLPGRFPNLLCNGSMGIAVGMATKIPPHNLREIASALKAVLDDPRITVDSLLEYVTAPDFPTGGLVYGMHGVREAYRTGRGIVKVRSKTDIETMKNGRQQIIVTEIPFLVNKSTLLEKIGEMVRGKELEGISNIRDESGRNGLRIVFEVHRDSAAEVVLNNLFKHSQLESTYGINMLAVVHGRPEQLNLKQLLQHYLDHRLDVIVRRTKYALEQKEERAHILEGYRIALDNLDQVIQIIRSSDTPEDANNRLIEVFNFSEAQSQAILAMSLRRLTGLEQDKIAAEYVVAHDTVAALRAILGSRDRQVHILKKEIDDLVNRFGDDRRTEVVANVIDFEDEDLITEEDMVVTISHSGYVKRLSPNAYRVQRRGGRGVAGMKTKDEDFVEHLFIASTHDYLLFLTSKGMCHWLKVYRIPEANRTSPGRAVVNLINIEADDKIRAIVPVRDFHEDRFLFTATKRGIVKKTPLSDYRNIRRAGVIALRIGDDDELVNAVVTDGSCDISLITAQGKAMRFAEGDVRSMGRVSTGVKGISLRGGDEVVDMVIIDDEMSVLTVCRNGYGKRTPGSDYPRKNRGGLGVINIKTTERNGPVVACISIDPEGQAMLVTENGVLIRMAMSGITEVGRNTIGVRVLALGPNDHLSGVTEVAEQEDEGDDESHDKPGAIDDIETDGVQNDDESSEITERSLLSPSDGDEQIGGESLDDVDD